MFCKRSLYPYDVYNIIDLILLQNKIYYYQVKMHILTSN